MTALSDVLQRMRAAERFPVVAALSLPVDASLELRGLIAIVEGLERSSGALKAPSASVMDEARRLWRDSGGQIDSLTARHIRALCGEPKIATDPAFVSGLARRGDLASKRQWLERLIDSYLVEWRAMREPQALESLLRRAIGDFTGRSDRVDKYRSAARLLFSPDAPTWLATSVVAERLRPSNVLEEWRVPASGGLGEATVNAALDVWVQRFDTEKRKGLGGTAAQAWFEHLVTDLLDSPMLDRRRVGLAVSAVILWDQAERNETIRGALESFLLGDPRFGDPRLPANRVKWEVVEPAARQRVVAWLSRQDLLFFFNFVITYDPHGRKDFWLRYVDQVEDSNVALSESDERRLRANTQTTERMRYSRVVNADVSAFLMRFRGARELIFVEFSESGNALYLHDAERFREVAGGIRNPRFNLRSHLKHPSRIETVTHHTSWQYNVQAFLARHGIRPS